MSEERTEQVCFSIDGDWFTGLLRDIATEDFRGHERAARMAQASLVGIAWDDVYKILQGNAKLVGHSPRTPDGENTLGMVDDDDREYKKRLLWLFGGCFYSGGKAWQPYAMVTGFGPKDFYGTTADRRRAVPSGGPGRARLAQERTDHYADSPGRDRAIILTVPDAQGNLQRINVLFKEVQLPVWWKPRAPHDDPQTALAEHFLLQKRLDERSHQLWYPEDIDGAQEDIDVEVDRLLDPNQTPYSSYRGPGNGERDAAISLLQARGQLDELREDVERYAEEEQDKGFWPGSTEEEEERRERTHQVLLGMYRTRIQDQAGPDDGSEDCSGWVTIEVTDEDCQGAMKHEPKPAEPPVPRTYRVPRAPFIRWSLRRSTATHLAPKWETVAPSGMKMYCDDTDHTDWMLGSVPSMDLDTDYREESLSSAAYRVRFAFQAEICGFTAGVLSGSGRTEYLRVVHPEPDQELDKRTIAVIPHAGPEYYIPAASSAATITERGGQLSHLAVVGRGEPTPIKLVHVPDALALYPIRTLVRVDCDKGEVKIQDY